MNKLLGILMILAVGIATATAQSHAPRVTVPIEDLRRKVIDTIKTNDPETNIIIFSNNTWEFYRPTISARLRGCEAYKTNWDTSSVFSYRNIELKDLPDIVELHLVDDLLEFCVPVKGKIISKYGPRRRRNHHGVDIPLKVGEPLFAAFEGKIRYAKFNSGGFGNLVIVRHPNGLETWYAHLSKLNCAVGDFVKAGQVIGYGGQTGRAFGPHLHFEVRYKDQTFDPDFLINFETGHLKYQTFALQKSYFSIHSRASEILEEDDYDDAVANGLLANADEQTIETVQNPKPAPQAVYHKIKKGDTLGAIAAKYKTTVDRICSLSGIKRTTVLQLNKSLRVK